ncbi:MAG: AtpZ/AtpI family protein [Lachnospiraceae bacterium]|nr:AtpZ/AtpI family protein [Lachnospiraceae bacterium]
MGGPYSIGWGVGYFLDKWLGTSFFFILLFFVGAAAGAWNVYRTVRTIAKLDERKENPYVSRIQKE